jgi:hypothetical protein
MSNDSMFILFFVLNGLNRCQILHVLITFLISLRFVSMLSLRANSTVCVIPRCLNVEELCMLIILLLEM